MPYYSGQGRVLIGGRDASGNPLGLVAVGNTPDFRILLETETIEHQESLSGQRLTDLRLIKANKGSLSLTLEDINSNNLEIALYGVSYSQSTGAVTDEVLHVGTPLVGRTYIAARQNISAVTVKVGSTTLTAGTQYTVNAAAGSIDLIAIGSATGNLTISYTSAAASPVAMFRAPLTDRWVRFEGVNTVDANKPIIVDIYRVSFNPAKDWSLIMDDLAQFPLDGAILADTTKPATGALGQFGRIVML